MLSVVSLGSWPLWLGFLAFVAVMLALDLGVFHRKAHVVSLREAAVWSGVWIALAARLRPRGLPLLRRRSAGSSSPPGTSSRRR